MKTAAIIFSLIAGCLSTSAMAHDYGRDGRSDYRAHDDRHERIERCDYRRPWVHEGNHRHHRRAGGAGPCHDIHRGELLPRYYWSSRHEVHNWRRHDLPRPWHGHRWVRTGNDFVMVGERGEISKVILMRHRR